LLAALLSKPAQYQLPVPAMGRVKKEIDKRTVSSHRVVSIFKRLYEFELKIGQRPQWLKVRCICSRDLAIKRASTPAHKTVSITDWRSVDDLRR
jgi:hypothetical protein